MDFNAIDAMKNELASLRPLNPGEVKALRDQFVIENTYNSNAIEGNTMTLRETALILQEGVAIGGKSVKEHLEIVGHKDAMEYVYSLVESQRQLTEFTIKEIHSLVLMNDPDNRGVYRKVAVGVGSHRPPDPVSIPQEMERLVAEYPGRAASAHPIEATAWLHLKFENVHPFVNGNGRTGRLLLNFELMKAGLLPIDVKFSDRAAYYQCFGEFDGKGDIGPMARLVAKYEEQRLREYLRALDRAAEPKPAAPTQNEQAKSAQNDQTGWSR